MHGSWCMSISEIFLAGALCKCVLWMCLQNFQSMSWPWIKNKSLSTIKKILKAQTFYWLICSPSRGTDKTHGSSIICKILLLMGALDHANIMKITKQIDVDASVNMILTMPGIWPKPLPAKLSHCPAISPSTGLFCKQLGSDLCHWPHDSSESPDQTSHWQSASE